MERVREREGGRDRDRERDHRIQVCRRQMADWLLKVQVRRPTVKVYGSKIERSEFTV